MVRIDSEILQYILDCENFVQRATKKNKVALMNKILQLQRYMHYSPSMSTAINKVIELIENKLSEVSK